MELYGGIDLHGNNNHIALIDQDYRVVASKWLPNDIAAILSFLEPHKVDIAGLAVESTYNWYWLVDGLMDADYRIRRGS